MYIYAFGSLCRGEIDEHSDVDLLLVPDEPQAAGLDRGKFSIYSNQRLYQLWAEGNPFAWHLSTEAKLLFSSDNSDLLHDLGKPKPYSRCVQDCQKFFELFEEAEDSIRKSSLSLVFDLSTVFLSVRNFATCYALGVLNRTIFSRSAARQLAADSVPISDDAYVVLERARMLSTRAAGLALCNKDVEIATRSLQDVEFWMRRLLEHAEERSRVR